MANRNDIDIRVGTSGTERTRAELRRTGEAVGQLGTRVRGLALPLLGGSLLAGLFGGALASLAVGGGAAHGSVLRLQSSLDQLSDTILNAAAPALDWFSGQSENAQFGILAAAGAVTLFRSPLLALARLLANPVGVALVATTGLMFILERQFGLATAAGNALGDALSRVLNVFTFHLPNFANDFINRIAAGARLITDPGGGWAGANAEYNRRTLEGGPFPLYRWTHTPQTREQHWSARAEDWVRRQLGGGVGADMFTAAPGGMAAGSPDARVSGVTINNYYPTQDDLGRQMRTVVGEPETRFETIEGVR